MKKHFNTIFCALLLAAATLASCGKDSQGITAGFITVFPQSVSFDADGKSTNSTLEVVSNTTWSVTAPASATWLTLSANSGNKKQTIKLSAIPAAAGEEEKSAELTFKTTNPNGEQARLIVNVTRKGGAEIPIELTTLTVDFQNGATISSPELPPYTKDNFVTGLHQYTIQNHIFSIYVDPDQGGKFYWIDNTQFTSTIAAPNKGLFFSKLGAYIQFPASAGHYLSTLEYIPTTSQSGDLAIDLLDSDGGDVDYSLTFPDPTNDKHLLYEILVPSPNKSYRLQIGNGKNAQCAKLVLEYKKL